jgi:LacI family transcriptional regulator
MPAGIKKKPRVKLEDVARMAEVSVATVSLALRGHLSIAEETRQRVAIAQKRLGYIPLRKRAVGSKALKERSRHRESMLYTVIDIPVKKNEYTAFLEGVMSACRERDVRLELVSLSSEEILADAVPAATLKETDGIILTGVLRQEIVNYFVDRGIKVVVLGNYDVCNVHRIEMDIVKCGGRIGERIVADGHKEVVGILGDHNNYYEREYLMGIRDVLELNGLHLPASHVFYADYQNLFASVSKVVQKILTKHPKVTAIFSHAREFADTLQAEFRAQSSKKLPDIYLVKSSPKDSLSPHLRMLNLNLERCGRLAVSRLHGIIKAPESVIYSTVLEPEGFDDESSAGSGSL